MLVVPILALDCDLLAILTARGRFMVREFERLVDRAVLSGLPELVSLRDDRLLRAFGHLEVGLFLQIERLLLLENRLQM